MKKTVNILILLALISIVGSLFLVLGSNIVGPFAMFLLGFIYFFLGFALYNNIRFRHIFKKSAYSGISALRLGGTIILGFATSLVLFGTLFYLMHYPGRVIMSLYGFLLIIPVFVVSAIMCFASKDPFHKRILVRSLLLLIIAGALNFGAGKWMYEFKYRNYPELLNSIYALDEDPNNPELQENYDRESDKMFEKEY